MKATPSTADTSTQAAESSRFSKTFSQLATVIAHATGKPLTFIIAMATILVWAISTSSKIDKPIRRTVRKERNA